jgi:antitoxin HicB
MKRLEYAVLVEPLSLDDGGGFLASVPDLPGCVADGETPEAALAAVAGAIDAWIDEAKTLGRSVPPPSRRAA